MNLGFPEMMFIFILALILFGPKKLPEIGRQIGKGLAEFKRASREFQSQIEDEVRKLEVEADLTNTIAPITQSLSGAVESISPTLTAGRQLETAHPDLPPTSASSTEVAAVAAPPDYDTLGHSDYTETHSASSSALASTPSAAAPASASSSSSTANSAGNA